MTAYPASQTLDHSCDLMAKAAMSYAAIIHGNLNEYPRSVATVVACADRIVALRTAELANAAQVAK